MSAILSILQTTLTLSFRFVLSFKFYFYKIRFFFLFDFSVKKKHSKIQNIKYPIYLNNTHIVKHI